MTAHVGIVGAGLSGLACAVELHKQGHQVTVLEASNSVGGRVKSDNVDGFVLDHGFQVYLPSYEMGKYFFDLEQLRLQSFSAGAYVFHNNKFHLLSDPLRDPKSVFQTVFSPVATISDKIKTLKLIWDSKNGRQHFSSSEPTKNYLQSIGFSAGYIDHFFTPFFSGVFLDGDLSVPHWYFLYLFQQFSKSYASLPQRGMGELAKQLAARLPSDAIVLNANVTEIEPQGVVTQTGRHNFDHVVCAVNARQAKQLDMLSDDVNTQFHSVTTHYYQTRSKQFASKTLFINGSTKGHVNHVACLSSVNPHCAPEGVHLFSVNTLRPSKGTTEETAIREDLAVLFGAQEIARWKWLKSYQIPFALPAAPQYATRENISDGGVILCGDYLETPSIQGALLSGKKAADRIVTALR